MSCNSLTGIFPTDSQVDNILQVRIAGTILWYHVIVPYHCTVFTDTGFVPKVVKPFYSIDEVVSLTTQRYASTGDSVGGGGISYKRKRKSDKRPCKKCQKLISGFTRHPISACIAYRVASKFAIVKSGALSAKLCFLFDGKALRSMLATQGTML